MPTVRSGALLGEDVDRLPGLGEVFGLICRRPDQSGGPGARRCRPSRNRAGPRSPVPLRCGALIPHDSRPPIRAVTTTDLLVPRVCSLRPTRFSYRQDTAERRAEKRPGASLLLAGQGSIFILKGPMTWPRSSLFVGQPSRPLPRPAPGRRRPEALDAFSQHYE